MNKFEKALWSNNYQLVAGLDEVGRGCIAGPLVCAIVIFPIGYSNDEIKDSKQLTHNKRLELEKIIKRDAIDFDIQIINPSQVDKLNPKQASRIGMKRCVENIKTKPDYLLIDFENIDVNIEQNAIIKGDQQSISIAAASILAKVYRDQYMIEINQQFPQYDFKNNKGYLTKKHLHALNQYGPIKNIHRFSYKPIAK